jgi:hypothetical protein
MDAASVDRVKLIGKWFGRVGGEAVALEFLEDGRLAYVVMTTHGSQVMRMTYRVEGSYLITDQPSHRREERTPFRWDESGALVLEFGGEQSRFTR